MKKRENAEGGVENSLKISDRTAESMATGIHDAGRWRAGGASIPEDGRVLLREVPAFTGSMGSSSPHQPGEGKAAMWAVMPTSRQSRTNRCKFPYAGFYFVSEVRVKIIS